MALKLPNPFRLNMGSFQNTPETDVTNTNVYWELSAFTVPPSLEKIPFIASGGLDAYYRPDGYYSIPGNILFYYSSGGGVAGGFALDLLATKDSPNGWTMSYENIGGQLKAVLTYPGSFDSRLIPPRHLYFTAQYYQYFSPQLISYRIGVFTRYFLDFAIASPLPYVGDDGVFGFPVSEPINFLANTELNLQGVSKQLEGRSISTWQWDFLDGSELLPPQTTPQIVHQFGEDSAIQARVAFVDQYGFTASAGKTFAKTVDGSRSDALTDQQGAMFTAANRSAVAATPSAPAVTAGVSITRHHVDNNGRYVGFNLQGVPNLQNPTLLQHPGTHALYLFAQDRTTKVWQLWGSDDWGEAWELMANSPMDTNYKVVPCALDSGGFALAGVKKSTTPPEVWFSRTWDGVAYDAIAGGTGAGQTLKLVGSKTGAKTVAIHQENLVGSARLVVIVDGTPFKFSEDFGDSWEDAAV